MITFYWYPKCSTCIKAKKLLEKSATEYDMIDITIQPPSFSLLKNILRSGDYPLKKLFNTSGVMYRELKIKDKLPKMSDQEALSLLSKHGKLIKRPIIASGKTYVVGYDEEKIKSIV